MLPRTALPQRLFGFSLALSHSNIDIDNELQYQNGNHPAPASRGLITTSLKARNAGMKKGDAKWYRLVSRH
ncbi:hypothetical protein [Terasakiella pusilla]|uniref:hypothetical protein n=1 Tax=Terasakiella pusilla TaxID=64973 RepID=UPI003AA840F7